jgi:cysteinyl-tRNA synthetase
MHILGESFDIHAGGEDLIFPHHENEIAQSEAATGKPFARYWMHNGFININKEKMSKSKGNFFTVRDIFQQFAPEVLRLFMYGAHYRSPLNYDPDLMRQAESALARLRSAKERLDAAPVAPQETDADYSFLQDLESFQSRFVREMDDDLNTAGALGILFECAHHINSFVSVPRGQAALTAAQTLFAELCAVLGLLQAKPVDAIPQAALDLLAARQAARKEKDFARADALRAQLGEMGYAIADGPQGSALKRLSHTKE